MFDVIGLISIVKIRSHSFATLQSQQNWFMMVFICLCTFVATYR